MFYQRVRSFISYFGHTKITEIVNVLKFEVISLIFFPSRGHIGVQERNDSLQ
jgi:hypothetical protein